ncbi:MAG: pre-peptidase [Planctomycetota bacterium]|nr:MAG: pre-peptidase [Planctomycetota bacterium]
MTTAQPGRFSAAVLATVWRRSDRATGDRSRTTRHRRGVAVLAVGMSALTCTAAVFAQTAYPMLMSVRPIAVPRGQTTECTVKARYDLSGTYRVLVEGAGVRGEAVLPKTKPGEKPKPTTTLKVRFTVAPDAMPGPREFRLATPRGVSTVGQLVVVRDPLVLETANNDTADSATSATVPGTWCGAIERNEDVDFFRFHATAGQRLVFHVLCNRLQNKIHDLQKHADPIITLRSPQGTTLAAVDNYFAGDPLLAYQFKKSGEYLLEIRDVRYQGNSYWEYCIEVSDRPFVTNTFPSVVNPGARVEFELAGFFLPQRRLAVDVPADLTPGNRWLPLSLGETVTNPVPVIVTDLPVTVESDSTNDTVEQAQPLHAIPRVVAGRLEREGDLDYYRLDVKKGDRLTIEVIARRHGSALDSYVRILDAKGRPQRLPRSAGSATAADDIRFGTRIFADSLIEDWTAPADGPFFVEIRDLHLRGGSEFVYALKIERARPYFWLFLDTDKTQVCRGEYGVVFARADRRNGFSGAVQLHIDGLPAGVTAVAGRIPEGRQDGCIILHADPQAELDVRRVRIWGTAVTSEEKADDDGSTHSDATENDEIVAEAVAWQELYNPGGGRGHWPVNDHVVAVCEPGDLRNFRAEPTEVVLRPGESKRIDVTFQRAEGFNKNVTLDMLFRHLSTVYADPLPAGVTIDAKNSKTLITGTNSKGWIVLTAAPDAPPTQRQLVSVMGNIALNFVMKWTYSSQPIYVTVRPKDDASRN